MTRPKPIVLTKPVPQRNQAECYRLAWERLYKELMPDDQRLIMDNPNHRFASEFAKQVILEGQGMYDKQH